MTKQTIEYEHSVGKCPVKRDGGEWYVCRAIVGSSDEPEYLSSDGRWCKRMDLFGSGNSGTYFDTNEDAAAMLLKWGTPRTPLPQWMDKPSCPGKWVCVSDPKQFPHIPPNVMDIDAEEIERGVPFGTDRVFGPIPDDVR